MKTGSKPETDIPTSGNSGSSSLPLCTEPIVLPNNASPSRICHYLIISVTRNVICVKYYV